MPAAARKTDPTAHGSPLSPGPASPDVNIGYLPAWRAAPAGVGAGVEAASNTMKGLMDSPALDPVATAVQLVQVQAGLTSAAGAAAGAGNAGAAAGVSGAMSGMMAANATLTAAQKTAAAAPGGEPVATQTYTEGIKAAAGAAAGAAVAAIAAGVTDIHNCPLGPGPHGPGVVTKGCATVFIDKLPAARQGDQVFEAAGGADPIVMGCPTVNIGDLAGGGGGGGGGAGAFIEPPVDESSDEETSDEETTETSGASGQTYGDSVAPPTGSGTGYVDPPPIGQDFAEEEELVMPGSEDEEKKPSLPPDWEPCREKTWWDDVKDWASDLFGDDDDDQESAPTKRERPEPYNPNNNGGGDEDEGEYEEEVEL